MNNYIKPPMLSTSFSENGKSAKKRFDNILDMGKKKKGIIAFSFVLLTVIIVGVIVSFSNNNIDVVIEESIPIKDRMANENYSAILMNMKNKDVVTQISNPENQLSNVAYEPSYPFRFITLAIALEEGVISLNDEYMCNGSINVSGYSILCSEKDGHGNQTIMQGMSNSCDPMIVDLAAKIGKEKFYAYMKDLGLDKIDGAVFHQKKNFNELELAISSLGQGFSVSPLQMAKAFSVIFNGDNKLISKKTSAQILDVLLKSADITEVNNIKVGILDGVSEKLPRGAGKYTYSTIAFAPLDNPQVICVSVLDEPKNGGNSIMVATEIIRENIKKQ